MTYSYLKGRMAKVLPDVSDQNINLLLPSVIGGATGLGALAYDAVAPLDVDPIGLAVGTGLALGTQGRTPYNYAGIAALGLEGARYLNNAFTNSSDTEASPLIAMGIGAGTLGLREALRRGVLTYPEAGFPTTGRIAQDLGKSSATTPITVDDVVVTEPSRSVAAPPRKPPPSPTRPTPNPRVAKTADVAPDNPSTGQASVVVTEPSRSVVPTPRSAYKDNDLLSMSDEERAYENFIPTPTIEDYIAKSPLLNKDRAMSYANPDSPDYQPDFVEMLSQNGLSDDFRKGLAFSEDVLANQFKGSGVPPPVATGATYLPIHIDSFNQEHTRGKLNSDVVVLRKSILSGGQGKSRLVNDGVVPEGTIFPNVVTSNPQSLLRMAQGVSPDLTDPGYYIGKDQVLTPPPTSVAREQYINLINSGRMATPMGYKNLSEPQLYVDELSGGSSPYDINDFYGLRSAKKRTTDKSTGTKYYRGVMD